ncbi:LytR C-terminal domain-containing protein [bacterium]|nr:LytR C-terminal domain-containing protein [bacterium]
MTKRKPAQNIQKKALWSKPKKEYQGVKKEKKKKTPRKNTKKLAKILLFIFIIVFVLYLVFSAVNILTTKTIDETANATYKNYLLAKKSGDMQSTLVVMESGEGTNRRIENAYLFLNNQSKGYSLLVYIPNNLYFDDVEETFGNSIPISALRYAGDYVQNGKGIEYSLWQINQLLGIRYQNYIWFSSEAMDTWQDIYGEIMDVSSDTKALYVNDTDDGISNELYRLHAMSQKYSKLKTLLKSAEVNNLSEHIYSNMSFFSIVNFIENYKNIVANSKTYVFDLSSTEYVEEKKNGVGDMIFVLDNAKFDDVFRSFYSKVIDTEIEKENVRVEIFNGSGISGAAYKFGRKVVNSGCYVLRYGNAPEDIEKTTIYVPNMEEYKNSYKVVSELLYGDFELKEGRPNFLSTGDIVVILGEDINYMFEF